MKRETTPPPAVLDPWFPWPGSNPYEVLSLSGLGYQASQLQVDDALFQLLELGLVDGAVQQAYDQLHVTSQRLLIDALVYDPEAAGDLLALLRESSPEDEPVPALNELLNFAWDC